MDDRKVLKLGKRNVVWSRGRRRVPRRHDIIPIFWNSSSKWNGKVPGWRYNVCVILYGFCPLLLCIPSTLSNPCHILNVAHFAIFRAQSSHLLWYISDHLLFKYEHIGSLYCSRYFSWYRFCVRGCLEIKRYDKDVWEKLPKENGICLEKIC